jgi:hypothetical protein
MPQRQSSEESHEGSPHAVALTETPATMSPPMPDSLPAHLASLASESDEWEDEDEEHDDMDLEHDGALRQQADDINRITLETLRRAAAAEWEEDDEEDGPGQLLPVGGSLYRDAHLIRQRNLQEYRKSDRLLAMNPYKLSLTRADLESCVALENAAFPADLAASREKVSELSFRTCLRHQSICVVTGL